jgi:hypothetical protein
MEDQKPFDFFTKADKNAKGGNASEYPAWMFDEQMEELRESIRQREHGLENDLIASSEKMIQRDRLRKEKAKLDDIESCRPVLDPVETDRLSKARKYLASEISRTMFNYSEMQRGTADAHEEARRMTEPIIPVKGEDIIGIIKACGVDSISVSGKITRNQAEKCWKIISAYLGEPSNTEVLRREK